MKSEVPYKFLDISPEDATLNFDFNSITVDEWNNDRRLQNMPVFADMYSFPILGCGMENWGKPATELNPRFFKTNDDPLTAVLSTEVRKLEALYNAKAVIATLDGLPPGGKILKHWDQQKIFTMCHRVHLPLITDPDVKFYIDDVEYHFPAGKFFEFDNQRYHEVKNNSNIFRIHMVIDLMPL